MTLPITRFFTMIPASEKLTLNWGWLGTKNNWGDHEFDGMKNNWGEMKIHDQKPRGQGQFHTWTPFYVGISWDI